LIWRSYIQRRGSLNVGRRVEQSLASLCLMFAQANFKQTDLSRYDFMPHEDEPEITLEQAIEQWK